MIISNYFKRPSQLSIEVARWVFCLASVIVFEYKKLITTGQDVYLHWNTEAYYPKGILGLIQQTIPSVAMINFWLWALKLSTITLVLGFASRISLALHCFSFIWLVSLSESFSYAWCHGYNLILLAELAFVFAPVGRMFAFDTIIRKKINRSVIPSENVLYIFMPQLAIALFFADAAIWKLFTLRDSLSLRWALSDNICNHIIERYLLIDKNIPNYLIPLFQHPWAYKTLALGNIFFQLAPLALVIFVQKPLLRILAGLCFVIEEFGLATVMHLFDYQWLILFLLFVDWDYFIQSRSKQKIIHIPFYQFVYFVLYISFFGICGLAIPYLIWKVKPNPEFNSYPFSAVSIYSSFIGTNSIGTYKCVKIGVSVPDVKDSVAVSALLASQFGSIRGATDTALLRKSFSAIPILLKNQKLDTNVRVRIYDEVVEYVNSPYPPKIKSIIKSLKAEYKNGRLYFVPASADFKKHYLVFHHQKKMNIYLFNEVLRTVFKIQPRMDSIPLNHPYLYGKKVYILNS